MSGPYFIFTDLGCANGGPVNHTGIAVNGFSGAAALYIDSHLDEEMFLLLIAGRLNVKEKVCADSRVGKDKAKAAFKYPAVCSKVRP
jgi:hypothetical protein